MPFLTRCVNYIVRGGLRGLGVGLTCILIGCVGVTPRSPSVQSFNNATQAENAKPGSADWTIAPPDVALNHEIEGFASATSANRGETIKLFVNTADPTYSAQIFRLGWYGGAGARQVASVTLSGTVQPICPMDPATLLVDCAWGNPYVLNVPDAASDLGNNWTSGIFLVKLTGSVSKKSSYIPFVVRDDARKSQIRFQSAINTWQAYNSWGLYSLYTSPRAFKVSFNRPLLRGAGGGDMISEAWELSALRFLEREGYDVTYATDLDTQENASELLLHKVLLFGGHDEYWSTAMRTHLQAAIDAGEHAIFLNANNIYWQVRYEPDHAGNPNRVMVCYKSTADPMITTDPSLTTVRFRDPPVNWPEEPMLGVMFNTAGVNINNELVVGDPSHWIFSGTGAHAGQQLGNYLGEEVDGQTGLAPAGTAILMNSPFIGTGGVSANSLMTIFQAPSGAFVFSSGTSNFALGLDNFHTDDESPVIVQMMRNLLSHLGATK
jgi:hypothetical protein